MNFNMIAYILGNIIRIEAALLAVPAFVSIWYQEVKAASAFVATIIACLMAFIISHDTMGYVSQTSAFHADGMHFRGL